MDVDDVRIVTLPTLKSQLRAAVEEYQNSLCIADLLHAVEPLALEGVEDDGRTKRLELIKSIMFATFSADNRTREVLASLLSSLHARGAITHADVEKAFRVILGRIQDVMLDYPRADDTLVQLLLWLIIDDTVAEEMLEAPLPVTAADDVDTDAVRAMQLLIQSRARDELDAARPTPLSQMRSMLRDIVKQYFLHQDVTLLSSHLHALAARHTGYEVVRRAVVLAMDGCDYDREVVSGLLHDLTQRRVLPQDMVAEGFLRLMRSLPELIIDTPRAPALLSKFIARAIVDGALPPDFLSTLPEYLTTTTPSMPGSPPALPVPMNSISRQRSAERTADGKWVSVDDAGSTGVPASTDTEAASSPAPVSPVAVSPMAPPFPGAPQLRRANSYTTYVDTARLVALNSITLTELRRALHLEEGDDAVITPSLKAEAAGVWGFPQGLHAMRATISKAVSDWEAAVTPALGCDATAADKMEPALSSFSDALRGLECPQLHFEAVAALITASVANPALADAAIFTIGACARRHIVSLAAVSAGVIRALRMLFTHGHISPAQASVLLHLATHLHFDGYLPADFFDVLHVEELEGDESSVCSTEDDTDAGSVHSGMPASAPFAGPHVTLMTVRKRFHAAVAAH